MCVGACIGQKGKHNGWGMCGACLVQCNTHVADKME